MLAYVRASRRCVIYVFRATPTRLSSFLGTTLNMGGQGFSPAGACVADPCSCSLHFSVNCNTEGSSFGSSSRRRFKKPHAWNCESRFFPWTHVVVLVLQVCEWEQAKASGCLKAFYRKGVS